MLVWCWARSRRVGRGSGSEGSLTRLAVLELASAGPYSQRSAFSCSFCVLRSRSRSPLDLLRSIPLPFPSSSYLSCIAAHHVFSFLASPGGHLHRFLALLLASVSVSVSVSVSISFLSGHIHIGMGMGTDGHDGHYQISFSLTHQVHLYLMSNVEC